MVRTASVIAALLLTALNSAVLMAPPASAAVISSGAISGVVRDEAGRALEGAEILVLAPEGHVAPVLRAVSDATGHFLVPGVAAGVYRVAAIKSGYIAALGRVNTLLRSSVDLVLHPAPAPGEPGSKEVQRDLSWALRLPPRDILKDVDAPALATDQETAPARTASLHLPDSIRGEVDHVVALGAWRSGSSGPAASLAGNETRMLFAGSLGTRGAIQVAGRHGSLDSDSSAPAPVSRAASDVDVDLSYDTGDDARLAMRAFYSSGDLELGALPGIPGGGSRQEQRSWGYEGKWHKQVDGSSRVAVQVGFQDASLAMDGAAASTWDPELRDASNRSIGAEGKFETQASDRHLMRFGIRAQMLSLAAPSARIGKPVESLDLEGTTGWSVLLDGEDQWALAGPFAVTYGLSVRQDFNGPETTVATPRVGTSWTTSRFKGHAELSYLTRTNAGASTAAAGAPPAPAPRSATDVDALGYEVSVETPLTSTVTVRGTASYIPLRSGVWGDEALGEPMYVSDGAVSDRFVALTLERSAANAKLGFRFAHGQADGTLAPALDDDVPVVLLVDRTMGYESLRFDTEAPRTGSSIAVEYRAIREDVVATPATPAVSADALKTVEVQFAQQIVRLAGGRATCRFLLNARSALGPASHAPGGDPAEARRFAALYQRVGAGVSLAF